MPRPRIDIESKADLIQELCKMGRNDTEIAFLIGISPRSMTNLRQQHEWLDKMLSSKRHLGRYTKRDQEYWSQHGGFC